VLGIGDVDIPQLTVTPYDGTTAATLAVLAPDGTTTHPATTTADGGHTWTGVSVILNQAGWWVYLWTVSGTGAGAEPQQVYVAANPLPGPPITTDPTTPVGQVRLLSTDLSDTAPLLTDGQIGAFLTIEQGNVRLAAAQALDTIASSEVLVSKVIKTQDLATDGAKVAAELRARAQALRDQAADRDAAGSLFAFDIVDYNPNSWIEAEFGELGVAP